MDSRLRGNDKLTVIRGRLNCTITIAVNLSVSIGRSPCVASAEKASSICHVADRNCANNSAPASNCVMALLAVMPNCELSGALGGNRGNRGIIGTSY